MLTIERKVVILTPTVGNPKLIDAVESVQAQTYSNIRHILVTDGKKHLQTVHDLHLRFTKGLEIYSTPDNTGSKGFYGHRIYAGYPFLIDADYVFFLDEDNWYKPDHVSSLIELIEARNLDFAYSLRDIHSADGTFVCHDKCESLGKIAPVYGQSTEFHVDTSAYCFRHSFLLRTCHYWNHGWGADRRYYKAVMTANHESTRQHTLCYRLGSSPDSVKADFFINGNHQMVRSGHVI